MHWEEANRFFMEERNFSFNIYLICFERSVMCMVIFENLNKFLVYIIHRLNIFFQTSGPSMPVALYGHSMVKLVKGQAILGGKSSDHQAKIYSMTCSNRNCIISLLNRELSVQKAGFVAIPIPDTISGCISGGKKYW